MATPAPTCGFRLIANACAKAQAEIEGDTLVFTAIPPRAKLPFAVTVVAWQYGRSNEPKLKTAAPVKRTFFIVKKMTA